MGNFKEKHGPIKANHEWRLPTRPCKYATKKAANIAKATKKD